MKKNDPVRLALLRVGGSDEKPEPQSDGREQH